MKDGLYDKALMLLVLLAPVLLVALSKWQYSLNRWYVPLGGDTSTYFSNTLQEDIGALPGLTQHSGATLIFIADSACPCTRATFSILNAAIKASTRKDLQLVQMDINHPLAHSPAWQRVIKQIPATPTLLVTDAGRLVYAGPVSAGNMCTGSVLKILGLSVLQAEPQKPVINWLEEGCYCPLQHSLQV